MQHGPLPDSVFIGDNQPVARPVAPTTASKAGKAALKRKVAAVKKRKTAGNTTGATKTTKKSKTKPKSGEKET